MNDWPVMTGETATERDRTRLYAGVLAVEVLVLAAIWLFQRHFGT